MANYSAWVCALLRKIYRKAGRCSTLECVVCCMVSVWYTNFAKFVLCASTIVFFLRRRFSHCLLSLCNFSWTLLNKRHREIVEKYKNMHGVCGVDQREAHVRSGWANDGRKSSISNTRSSFLFTFLFSQISRSFHCVGISLQFCYLLYCSRGVNDRTVIHVCVCQVSSELNALLHWILFVLSVQAHFWRYKHNSFLFAGCCCFVYFFSFCCYCFQLVPYITSATATLSGQFFHILFADELAILGTSIYASLSMAAKQL